MQKVRSSGKLLISVTAWVPFGESDAPIWTCYLADDDAIVVGMNFGWLTNRATPVQLQRLANNLRSIPDAAALLKEIESSDFTRRPNLPITALVPDEAMATLLDSFESLLSG